ncbi:PAS-domain containing protein [Pseudorhodoferax aquiterrae]|nr:PAS-domain containing protein [Pseudorhodoferax aquiterrae]
MTTIDATERLQRYASLQAALDLIDQGFTLMDEQLRLVAWNAAFGRLLDFPPAMLHAGAPFASFIRYNAERGDYGPGDVEAQVAERVAQARRFEAHAFERTRPDGQVLQVSGRPVPGVGFITLYSDVTAQRQAERQIREHAAELERRVAERTSELRLSEAQMRLITDSLPALIAYFDARKAYRYINRGYVEWFGLDPQRLDAISARQYLGDAVYDSIRPNVARAFDGEPVSFEYEARCVDGRVRTARTTLIPEKAADGTVVGCFELTFDVSELRRAQERLAHTEKMEALGQLTSGIAHDFNNMLTVIVGNLGAMRERGIGGAAAAEFLEPTLAAAGRGTGLIRSLLGFARRQPLQAQATDVAALADAVARLLRSALPRELAIAIEADGAPDAWVDSHRLQDALVNLVLNARDARATRVRLCAAAATLDAARAAELQAAPGRYVRVDLHDDGHGMDAATRAHVFEPFFTTKRPGAGTGLGLAMVYGFVRQSGGGIDLASRPGLGTTVSLWLPLAGQPAAPARAAEAAPGRIAAQALALLVEDDAEVRQVVCRALVDLGYAVLQAESGAEALEILGHAQGIALVLSDVVMPGEVDGRAVARQARAAGVPRVALMSGYAPAAATAEDAGWPLLPKPFTQRELARFLQELPGV